jgi:hypothetical protein
VNTEHNSRIVEATQMFDSTDSWEEFKDVIPNIEDTSLKSKTFLEQMNTTKDKSDYLWHSLRYLNLFSPLHLNLGRINGVIC